jgi:thioredoxin 1
MAEIINTTDTDFTNDVSESGKLVIVDLWAEWCGPCKMMDPVLKDIAELYNGKVKVVRINIDHNQNTPVKFSVMNIPTLLFFKNGKEVDRVIGAVPKRQLMKKLDAHL